LRIVPSDDPDLDGEIAIRGPIVMQGYFNRPDATAAVMRDGWFLTGDLGRLDGEGRLTITGRKKEVIVLAPGKNIYPEEIEATYRRSPYVKEVCVLGLTREDEPATQRLYAVVVPDMARVRERRIVNTGDLLRFEMEGQSIHLPPDKRVLAYELWFTPLPRTTTGKIKRHEIERIVRGKQRQAIAAGGIAPPPETQWPDRHSLAAAAVINKRAKGAAVRPESNLELDLGLDSMERVELLTELEQRFGVRIPAEQSHHIATVQQLIDAVTPGADAVSGTTAEDSWAVMLRDLPSVDHPVLGYLLRRRPIAAPVLFALLRVVRVIAGVRFTGASCLPPDGPYIIGPNHQGYLDPFFICGGLPYRVFRQLFFVGAAEYFQSPVMRWIAMRINLVPVDPDAHLVPAMKACAFGLAHGKILVLFPEGERSIDGAVKRFKKGAPVLSRHLQVPVVPVAIRGAFELWPRTRGIQWRRLIPGGRRDIRVAFGAPIMPPPGATDAEAAEALRHRVDTMWHALTTAADR
jgi:long-chain acyl-CoA synthetase